ncbi:hypothetical protein ZIOFF_035250 [Zingiber officinale]|uniref:Uncharacterized protein n=1 Tax=Zingiber officinale TaxID=94328 RepID=A0A8J5L7F3_ZINOF|nr:hypothetical protein ZIOFF_035250 [Zingiber officinale]
MVEQPVADERLVVPAIVSVLSAILLWPVERNDAASDGQRAPSAFQGVRKPSISMRHYGAHLPLRLAAPPATSSCTYTSTLRRQPPSRCPRLLQRPPPLHHQRPHRRQIHGRHVWNS